MYIPKHFEPTDQAAQAFLATVDAGHLVTNTADGLKSTFLPIFYNEQSHSYRGHIARGNSQWKLPCMGEALFIANVASSYISPSWYATKAINGKVVPTWDYMMAHVYGDLVIHDDAQWLREQVTALSNKFESRRDLPWKVEDAPEDYMVTQLRGIVGFELTITRMEVSFKMSQNKTKEDLEGVIAGLASEGNFSFSERVAHLSENGHELPAVSQSEQGRYGQ